MNHKRKRPKRSRSGCLTCKPWKSNGMRAEKPSVERVLQIGKEERRAA